MTSAPRPRGSLRQAVFPDDELVDETSLRGVEFLRVAFASTQVAGADIERCRFEGTSLPARLEQLVISESEFVASDLANLDVVESSLLECAITGSRMTGTTWVSGTIRDVSIDSTRMDLCSFRYSTLKAVTIADCDLRQVDFQRAKLRNVLFERCDLTGAQFGNAEVHNVRFRQCTLDAVGGVVSLKGATMSEADLISFAWSMAKELGIKVDQGSR